MTVTRLDHVNVLTDEVEAVREFFKTVIGLEDGPRPAFRSPGYWLYHDGHAMVHLSYVRNREVTHPEEAARRHTASTSGKGTVDHFAFRCSGYRAMKQRLAELGLPSVETEIPGVGDRQVFVEGPASITVELIFSAADVAGNDAPDGTGGAAQPIPAGGSATHR